MTITEPVTQAPPVLLALADVLALIDTVAAEPGTYAEGGVNRQKVWLAEPSVGRLKARVAALPQRQSAAPAQVHGLDAQGWHDTALRFHAALRIIAHTKGNSLTLAWAQAQALHYLGAPLAGSKVWVMPDTGEQVQVVVPDSVVLPERIQPMPPPTPLASLKPGEAFTATLEVPRADAG